MPTPKQAILRGHLTVTLPVLLVITGGYLVGRYIFTPAHPWLGLVCGAGLAWPVWSFLVPRWRDWAQDSGVNPADIQDMAVRSGLLWPTGSFLERTEFKRRNGKVGW